MPIISTDIKFYHSGAGSNSDQTLDLGGAISSSEITDNSDNNTFSDVSGTEAAAGSTKYRGEYTKNTHGSLSLTVTHIWIESNTTSADDTVAIALAGEGVNATMETVANEDTAPIGESFTSPANYAAGLVMGTVAAGQRYGYWTRRIVNAGAAAITGNAYQLKVQGDTAA